MKNFEILELYDFVNSCLGRFTQTNFCLGLAHNKRRLQPIVDAIKDMLEAARPKVDNFDLELKKYLDSVDEKIHGYCVKGEDNKPLMAGPGAYRVAPEKVDELTSEIKKIRGESSVLVKKYLDRIDEIRNSEYENALDFYKIKAEYLPSDLGGVADKIFVLIGE